MKYDNKKVFITGGDRGIGKELVKVLIAKGVRHIAIMSRSLSGFKALEKEFESVNFLGYKGNVANPKDVREVTDSVSKQWQTIDLVINNAGVVSAGHLEELSDDDIAAMITVNLTGPVLLTKYFFPLLRKSEQPQIVNLSSGLGLIAMPFYAVYASTKAAIRQFSDAIRREFAPHDIHVLCVYPTATDTDMMTSAKRKNMDSPEMVARETIEALERGEINIIFGGRQREKDALFNFAYPLEMDTEIIGDLEKLEKATQEHRSM